MSESRTFYVYALKDPTSSPSNPFYIGKGTGVRAWEHELSPDQSDKGERIRAIQAAGREVLVTKLVEQVTESQALKIEAELISAFGTKSNGGLLTNAVMPSGFRSRETQSSVVVPSGVVEKAQIGLSLLKSAVLELITANECGLRNGEVGHTLGLQSDYLGGSKDYLVWSLLGLLMREGRVKRVANRRHQAQVR